MPKFAAIKQPESLAKMAYEAIRQSILSGQWKIGELYNEKAIAADLGISRTPVREALLEHVQNNSRFSEPTASGAPAKDRPEAEEEPQP